MTTVLVNGITLDYETRGDAVAPPLLLIMGLGMPAALWPDGLVDRLVAEGFRVVTFDNRDCGGSTRLKGVRAPAVLPSIWRALRRRAVHAPYTLDHMAADTVRLLDTLGITRAHLVGASMGGMIAQVIAARYPQRVSSLTSIMSSTGNPARKTAFGRWRAVLAIIRPPPPPDDTAAVVKHLERVFRVIGSPAFREYVAEMRPLLERVARRGLYRQGTQRQLLAILASGDRRELLREIDAPTLVIHGADDPLVPLAAGCETAASIRGARLDVIEGMGHDFPPRLMAEIAGRIAAHCRASQSVAAAVAAAPAASAATDVSAPGAAPAAASSAATAAAPASAAATLAIGPVATVLGASSNGAPGPTTSATTESELAFAAAGATSAALTSAASGGAAGVPVTVAPGMSAASGTAATAGPTAPPASVS